jgi:hypothetical protein
MNTTTFREKMGENLLLILFMVAMTFQVKADPSTGHTGLSDDPYPIATLADLQWIADEVNNNANDFSSKYFIQTADIDASATSGWNSGAGWTAIGGTDNYYVFSGSYDGQGYTISNLYINNPSANYYGLFGYCANATIKNLGLTNVSMLANSDIGGLVGYMEPGTISNCYVTGSVTAKGGSGFAGGLCGEAYTTNVDNCYAACTVVAEKGAAGGLIAYLSVGSLTNSYSSGSVAVNSEAWEVGGLLGSIYSGASVKYCFSESSVSTNGVLHNEPYNADVSNIGGLIGLNGGTVANCYARGSVTVLNAENESEIGGLLGENTGTVSYSYSTSSLSVTPVSANTPAVGGFVGVNYDESSYGAIHYPTLITFAFTPGTVNNNCFWDSSIYANGCGSNSFTYVTPYTATFSATGKTTAEMQTKTTFTNALWDFLGESVNGTKDYWNFISGRNNDYPVLIFLPRLTTNITTFGSSSATMGGSITNDGNGATPGRGIVYSLSTANTNPTIGGSGVTQVANVAITNDFSASITGLSANKTYYVRAYATNSKGTSYGSARSFTTSSAPAVSSVSVPADNTYKIGDNLDFTVNFSDPITVVTTGGTPYISITLNTGGTVQASYHGGTGTAAIVFRYTIASGNLDADGITVGSSITLGGGTLKSSGGIDATLTLNSVGSTTNVKVDGVAPTVSSVNSSTANATYKAGDAISIQVNFSEAVTVTGTPQLTLETGTTDEVVNYASGSGTSTLTFTYTVQSGDVSFDLDYQGTTALALNGGTIKDAAGNNATLTLASPGAANSLGSNKDIVIDTTAPTVSSVGVPSNSTYVSTQNLDFTVNFSEAVNVVTTGGTSYLTVTIGSTDVHASYLSGSGTTALVFRYTIASGDLDNDGITLGTSITLNSGTLKDAVGNGAILTLNSIASTAAVLVDAVAPTVTVTSTASANINTSPIPVTITFSESVTGFDVGDITVANGSKGTLSGSGTTYTIDITPTGQGAVTVDVAAGVATDAAGNGNTAATQLSRTYDTVSPTTTLFSTTTNATNASPIPVTITFSESVTGFDAGDITVTNATKGTLSGSGASYSIDITPSGQGAVTVNVAAGVATDAAGNGNTAATQLSRTYDGISPSVTVSSLIPDPTNVSPVSLSIVFSEAVTGFILSDITVGNGTASNLQTSDNITWTADISPAHMGAFSVDIHTGVAQDLAGNGNTASAYFQRTYDPVAPTISSVSAPSNATYIVGQNLDFTVNFSEDVIVTTNGGTPYLTLTIGSTPIHAAYLSGSYYGALTFRYTVASGDLDSDGITVGASITLNGGTIKDYAGNNTGLTLTSVGSTNGILVDGVVPTVSSVGVPSNSTYVSGQALDFTVNFSKVVTVVTSGGTPYLTLTIGSAPVHAVYLSGSGTTALTFRYTVATGDLDTDGVAVGASITLNSGTLKDYVGNNSTLALNSVGSTAGVLVDAVAPSISSFTYPLNGNYLTTQDINFLVNFSEPVTVLGGTPYLTLTIGSSSVHAGYVSGSGSANLLFRYTVAPGDADLNGIDVSANISANGATIKDAAGNNASLAFSAFSLSGVLVNIVKPTVTTQAVTSISITTATGNGNITDLGIPNPTAYGVCWNTGGTPTVSDSKVDKGAASSTGVFTASMSGLTANTVYHVRSFASNIAGTNYGSEVTFTTSGIAPTVTTQAVTSISTTTATGNGNITDLGVPNPTAYGVCWNTGGTPTVSDSKVDKGAASSTGAFTVSMSGLTANTVYHVRSFASNIAGTNYGSEVTFTTSGIAPTVTTQAVTGISTTTATGNGNITDLGIPNPTAYGVCWNTGGTPTVSDSKVDKGAASSTGAFTASMSGLTANTVYHVRSFASNIAGTNYGSEVTFTTSGIAPTVTTQAVTSISATTATGNGNITDLGVPNPTAYGVCWNTGGTPTVSDSKVDKGAASSTGAFTASMSGLTANTVYHVRSFATNIAGTSYGSEVTFTTLASSTSISGTANWSTGVWTDGTPATTSNVTVGTGSITVDGNYTVNDLTVSPGGALNIGSGNTLTVNGNLVLTSDGTSTASLIINGTLNVTGTTTVQRYMVQNKWYIVSPTASGQTVSDFLTANTNIPTNSSSQRAMQDYNTTSNSWNPYFTLATPGTMDAGKGYAARISATGHVNFVGALAFGNKDVTVTRTGDNGWNCVGNPYTSAININTAGDATNNFLSSNVSNLDPSYAAIYIWDEYDVNNGSQNYYKVISNAQFTLPNTALGQNSVQVGQGFLVKVKTLPSVVSFTPAMQVIQNGLALKSAKTSWPAVELTVKTDGLSSFTDIAYNEKMTLGLDPSYDAGLLRGGSKLSVYSHLVNDNGLDFAIQCLPENQIENMAVPIGIDYEKGGEVKISAQSVELPAGTKVILEDKVLNSFTDLTDGAEYKVTVSPDTKGIGRFYLHTTNQIISGLNNAVLAGKLTAYAIGNTEIRIVGKVSSKAIATLYDVQGKVVMIENLNEGTLNVLPTTAIKQGIYMLSVRDNGTLQTFKFVIRP